MNARIFTALALSALLVDGGELLERYRLTLDRVRTGGPPLFDEAFILADVIPRHERRFTEFSGDLSGRWLGALAAAGVDAGPILSKIIEQQKPAGFFGDAPPAGEVTDRMMALLWGNGRLLVGLLEAHRFHADAKVLASARRLGDWFLSIAPLMRSEATRRAFEEGKLATGYICWLQNTEGLAELYRVTRDERYLHLAAELALLTVRKPGQHSHGFLTAVRGIVDLYQVTKDEQFLRQAERLWKEVVDAGDVLPNGAVPEAFAPDQKRDEGCSEADWLRLSLALWRLTQQPVYLERAERSLFNEFAVNQFPGGDFGHTTILPVGEIGPPTARAWWCCTLHGLRAFPDIRAAAFHAAGDGAVYDLPIDAFFDDGFLRVEAVSNLAKDATVTLRIEQGNAAPRRLRCRTPAWASALEYTLNGRPASDEDLRRVWSTGDRLTVRYRLSTRQEKHLDRIALVHGPWLLAVDELSSPHFFDEPHRLNQINAASLEPAPAAGPLRFGVPAARFRARYYPGGYPSQPASFILRPLAEQTGLPRASAWEYLFLLR